MKLSETKILLALANKGKNTADLARATGYSLSTIRAYLNFKRNPTTKALGAMAKALECSVTDIIE